MWGTQLPAYHAQTSHPQVQEEQSLSQPILGWGSPQTVGSSGCGGKSLGVPSLLHSLGNSLWAGVCGVLQAGMCVGQVAEMGKNNVSLGHTRGTIKLCGWEAKTNHKGYGARGGNPPQVGVGPGCCCCCCWGKVCGMVPPCHLPVCLGSGPQSPSLGVHHPGPTAPVQGKSAGGGRWGKGETCRSCPQWGIGKGQGPGMVSSVLSIHPVPHMSGRVGVEGGGVGRPGRGICWEGWGWGWGGGGSVLVGKATVNHHPGMSGREWWENKPPREETSLKVQVSPRKSHHGE